MTVNWRASSHSFSNGNCAEIATWRKSTRSSSNGDCAEVTARPQAGNPGPAVLVRDSKLGDASPVLAFTPAAWRGFLTAARAGNLP